MTMLDFWQRRKRLSFPLKRLFAALKITKQAFYQWQKRYAMKMEERAYLEVLIFEIREDHPTMGCRDMYYKLRPLRMGRDAFEQFCKELNLSRKRPINPWKTTDSRGVIRFDNLLKDLQITRINQAYQSDITFFEVQGVFCFITLIIDCYSRRIVGHQVSKRLSTAHTTLPALRKAIRTRRKDGLSLKGAIFHSDGGGQYFAKDFIELTAQVGIKNSMCKYPWENGIVERLNGVMKNNYLHHWSINSFPQLVKAVDRFVQLYNYEKPHSSLKRMTPMAFEKLYLCTDAEPKPTLTQLEKLQTKSVKPKVNT